MKAKITKAEFKKEYESKFGTMYSHLIGWGDQIGFYSSKKKDQTFFKIGEECEFTIEKKMSGSNTWNQVKPVYQGKFSNYNKDVKREQSKYSGFGVSYVKDLIVAGKIEMKDWEKASDKIIKFMVKIDKEIGL